MSDLDKEAELIRLRSLLKVQDGAMAHRAARIRQLEAREGGWASACLRWVEELNREHERAMQLEARLEFVAQLVPQWQALEQPQTHLACAEELALRLNTVPDESAVRMDYGAMAERVEKLGAHLRLLMAEREASQDDGK